MRTPRDYYKPKGKATLLHIYNHCVDMPPGMKLFEEPEKYLFIKILKKYSKKYNLGLVSYHIMNNHFHLLMYCPKEKLTPEEAAVGYNDFHSDKPPISADDPRAINLARNSNNISEFMREIQCAFSKEFNKTRPYLRRGTLWLGRYKSQLIDTDQYFLTCLYYVELNGVRSGFDKNPEDSLFSSYGHWCSTGEHPNEAFMIKFLEIINSKLSLEEFKKKMQLNMQRLKALDELKFCQDPARRDILKSKLSGVSDEIRKQYELVQNNMTSSSKIIGDTNFAKRYNSDWQASNKASP